MVSVSRAPVKLRCPGGEKKKKKNPAKHLSLPRSRRGQMESFGCHLRKTSRQFVKASSSELYGNARVAPFFISSTRSRGMLGGVARELLEFPVTFFLLYSHRHVIFMSRSYTRGAVIHKPIVVWEKKKKKKKPRWYGELRKGEHIFFRFTVFM